MALYKHINIMKIIVNKNGNSLNPLIFTNYNDEHVVMNGTLPINSLWTPFNENIWETSY